MKKLLLIDDDVDLTAILAQYLIREGFEVDAVHDGQAGVIAAQSGQYQMIILDIMMPKMSGIEVLRRIRQSSQVPVLMLTARGDNIDRIVGLDMGADDYVPKPCALGEIAARIRAILRRSNPVDSAQPATSAPQAITAGPLVLWPGNRKASWQGQALDLTGTEYCLLEVLAKHAGQLVSKQDISQQAFGKPLAPFDRRIDVHISSIRQKLGKRPDGQSWIHSVRGQGYQLLED